MDKHGNPVDLENILNAANESISCFGTAENGPSETWVTNQPPPPAPPLGQVNMYDLCCGGGRAHASEKRLQTSQEPSCLHKNERNEHNRG